MNKKQQVIKMYFPNAEPGPLMDLWEDIMQEYGKIHATNFAKWLLQYSTDEEITKLYNEWLSNQEDK